MDEVVSALKAFTWRGFIEAEFEALGGDTDETPDG